MLKVDNLQILPAEEKNVDEIYNIEKENFKFCWSKEYFLFNLKLAKDICEFYVAKVDDIVVGYVVCHISDKTAHILNISVKKEYQGCGIGSKLLDFLLNKLQHYGVKSVILEVRVDNIKAINLYKKFGFSEVKILPKFYHDGKDAILMLKNIVG